VGKCTSVFERALVAVLVMTAHFRLELGVIDIAAAAVWRCNKRCAIFHGTTHLTIQHDHRSFRTCRAGWIHFDTCLDMR